MRGKVRVRRGGHAHRGRGARHLRAPRPLLGCTGQRLPHGPDGAGHGDSARVTADHSCPSHDSRVGDQQPPANVEPHGLGPCHARGRVLHGFCLLAANRPAHLTPCSTGSPARPAERHPFAAASEIHQTGRDSRNRRCPNPTLRARSILPAGPLTRATGASAASLAGPAGQSCMPLDISIRRRNLGHVLHVDDLPNPSSPFESWIRWRSWSLRV